MAIPPGKVFIFWSKSTGKYAILSALLAKDGWVIYCTANSSLLAQLNVEPKRLACLAILNPNEKLTAEDVRAIEGFIVHGHKVLIASSASNQESRLNSNINELVKLFGASFNEDCVIRPNPFELYHPNEALLEDFVVNRGLGDSMARFVERKSSYSDQLLADVIQITGVSPPGPRIVYPRGCTIKVHTKSATVMMTSSQWALPSLQAICLFYRNEYGGRLVLLGSSALMSDKYICKEDNKALVKGLVDFIARDDFPINVSDARTIDLAEYNMTANMDKLLNTPMWCLEDLEQLPEDVSTLIDKNLFFEDNSGLPEVIRAYEELNVFERPLTLIRPTMSWHSNDSSSNRPLKFLFKRANGEIEFI